MLKKTCNILLGILIIVLLLIAGVLFVPKFIGYESFAVVSGSMEPKLPIGSVVFTKEVAFDDLKEGDIISFRLNAQDKATHRIVAVDKEKMQFTTKGDANNVEDKNPVAYNNVIGKVDFVIPLLGFISVYMKTPLGIAVGCGVVFVIVLLNFLPEIFEKDKQKEK